MSEKEETPQTSVPVIADSRDGSASSNAEPTHAENYHTLGSVQLHNKETGLLLLVPTPSNDPNDPLVPPNCADKLTLELELDSVV
jgi:hypothetical protein